jgi:hypothetical protein
LILIIIMMYLFNFHSIFQLLHPLHFFIFPILVLVQANDSFMIIIIALESYPKTLQDSFMIQIGSFERQLIKVTTNCYIPQISYDFP